MFDYDDPFDRPLLTFVEWLIDSDICPDALNLSNRALLPLVDEYKRDYYDFCRAERLASEELP